jgi:hypothetical protein
VQAMNAREVIYHEATGLMSYTPGLTQAEIQAAIARFIGEPVLEGVNVPAFRFVASDQSSVGIVADHHSPTCDDTGLHHDYQHPDDQRRAVRQRRPVDRKRPHQDVA